MTKRPRAKPPLTRADSRREADARRDEVFFADRKAQDAKNLEKTRRLREQRLAHEAAGLAGKPKLEGRSAKASKG